MLVSLGMSLKIKYHLDRLQYFLRFTNIPRVYILECKQFQLQNNKQQALMNYFMESNERYAKSHQIL